jgi:hypothetical protein
MQTYSADAPRPLPDRPNLRHVKDQAKALLKAGGCGLACRGAVQDRTPLRISELAEIESACGVARGDRPAQACD